MAAEPEFYPEQEQPSLVPSLAGQAAEGKLGHAYILCGQQALEQALLLAQALLCGEPVAGRPCQACNNCRRVAEHIHVDCHLLRPENNAHKIEAMRQMQATAYLKSYEGGAKVFIIEGAELLLEEAANSLLKLLEEPPEATYFLLVCAYADKLLPTIKSRCQMILLAAEQSFVLDQQRLCELRPLATELICRLPGQALWQALQEARRDDWDKNTWLHFLYALWQLAAEAAKGELDLPFQPGLALKAALLLEHALDCLRRNINQKLLLDIVMIRLWHYVEHA